MAYSFNAFLDRWKTLFLSFTGQPEFRDHLLRTQISYSDFTITAAEMDALNATPKTILAAPGAGLTNFVIGVGWNVVPGATPFELGSGVIETRYTDGSGVKVTGDVPNGSVETATAAPYLAVLAAGVPVANAAIVAKASADVTAGDGTVYGRIYYLTIKMAELPA